MKLKNIGFGHFILIMLFKDAFPVDVRNFPCKLYCLLLKIFLKMQFFLNKLECIKEEDTKYCENITCEIKTVGRGVKVLTTTSDLTTKIDNFYANFGCFSKSSSNRFVDVFNNTFNYCEAVESKTPTMVTLLLPLVSTYAPNLIHKVKYLLHYGKIVIIFYIIISH